MLTINRRKIMLGAVAGSAGALLSNALPGSVAAQPAPSATVGNAGHYRFQVGGIAATILSDGLIGGPLSVYAGDAPEAELEEVLR